jgi:hypothetical protein
MDKLLPPNIPIPTVPPLPKPVLDLPRIAVPSYAPIVLPYSGTTEIPSQTTSPEEQKPSSEEQKTPAAAPPPPPTAIIPPPKQSEEPEDESTPSLKPELNSPSHSAETTSITFPGTDIQIPVPKADIISAAAITSAISVAAALSATAVFKRLVTVLKPIITQVLKRVQKLRGKKVSTWSRQRLELRRRKQVHKETPGG